MIEITKKCLCSPNILLSAKRFRYYPRPGTLEQRLFREVTKPIIKPIEINPDEKREHFKALKAEKEKNNPYRKFLVNRCKEDFLNNLDGKVVFVIQSLDHDFHEFVKRRNALFDIGFTKTGFPTRVVQEASEGTRYKIFSDMFCVDGQINMYFWGKYDPATMAKALNVINKCPFLILLGGLVDYRVMNVNQLKELSKQTSLEHALSTTCALLDKPAQNLLRSLQHNSRTLVNNINSYKK